MNKYYEHNGITIYHGNSLEVLKEMDSESVQCCVTSPPYWGLRDYGVEGQLGLEKTPDEYVEKVVEIFHEVNRVLKKDATLWLNLGDSYAGSWGNSGNRPELDGKGGTQRKKSADYFKRGGWDERRDRPASSHKLPGLKPKDLVGIPWRVAFALQADGWYLRSDIIWAKPNPMPESVTDRPTKSHEYIFLMSKNAKYFYDNEAVKEPSTMHPVDWNEDGTKKRKSHVRGDFGGKNTKPGKEAFRTITSSRNKRTVWTVTTKPYKEAHFATFPPDLIAPCIKAGSRKGDIVLDPFGGSMTTAYVSKELNRKAIMIELNVDYVEMGTQRLSQEVLPL